MAANAPGRHRRQGVTSRDLMVMFPDAPTAERWFEDVAWGETGRYCPRCASTDTKERPTRKPMPYWCRDCRAYFSVRTGTPMERSKIPFHDWAVAIYLQATSLKGVSSMRLHRELGITQKSAWFLAHRIREAYEEQGAFGDAEMDEAYFGGKEKNKHKAKKLNAGRGTVGKTAIVGVRERASGNVHAEVATSVAQPALHGIAEDRTKENATVYTDDARAYQGVNRRHEVVRHSAGEYVRGNAHTNGIESFWATLKRAHIGVFHKLSPKHLHRYANEFAGRNNIRDLDTIDQMRHMVACMVGKRLTYKALKAPHPEGLSSHARALALGR